MAKAQYGILRFAKYKGPEISNIEAHNKRTKETYASNPDVDLSRSKFNFHLIEPRDKYRAQAEARIRECQCPRVCSNSVRVVETLITASPEFFEGKKREEVRAYFEHALGFLQSRIAPENFISAVVHMDEKTPHMHVSFVPITEDGRLSAKEIVGNKKKLTEWQDGFWQHMVEKYPDLERGKSASITGRTHIPPRLFKEAEHLDKQLRGILAIMDETNAFTARKNVEEIRKRLKKLFPKLTKFKETLTGYEKGLPGIAEGERKPDKQGGRTGGRQGRPQQAGEGKEADRAAGGQAAGGGLPEPVPPGQPVRAGAAARRARSAEKEGAELMKRIPITKIPRRPAGDYFLPDPATIQEEGGVEVNDD